MTGAEQPYRVYVEQMQEGAVTVSSAGMILYCNRRFAEMVKRPLEKVISSHLSHYLPHSVWEHISGVFRENPGVIKQVAALHGSRQLDLPVNLTASRLPVDGQEIMCLVVTDLSGQKEAEAFRQGKELAEKASAAKDHFLAALSHELRTPLTPALMVATALEKDRSLPENVQHDIALIRRNVELEARLIDDLLDLTRIRHGKLTLNRSDIDMHMILNRAIEICQPDVLLKNQQLKVELHARKVGARGDAVRLQQVFWNVIRNAVKFTRETGSITISTSNAAGTNKIRVSITDTGIGFPPESASNLFQAFEQGGGHITHQYGGLGLGLVISRSIMEAHDGTIRAESPGPGRGAVFTLEFPLADPARTSPSQAPFLSSVPTPDPSISILLVEDHKDTRMSIQRLLEIAGHKVTSAASAHQALAFASADKFDLVVSDLGLPDQTGHELMTQLKSRHGLEGIALSGYGMEEDIERSRLAGFRDHLTKPVSFDQLKEMITQFSNHRK
jgi:signal transduction histidine kinase/CheY-like chemotaxis protein